MSQRHGEAKGSKENENCGAATSADARNRQGMPANMRGRRILGTKSAFIRHTYDEDA
jgi:hypothetical protein